MKILVIGSGGREHALVWKLAQSEVVEDIYAIPGNIGMKDIAILRNDIDIKNHAEVSKFINENDIKLVVVGPEAPLVDGIADSLRENGIYVFGPSKASAILEGSKVFMKEFCKKYNIPTADYKTCLSKDETIETAKRFGWPVVLKADGLAAGKGVLICENETEAIFAAKQIFDEKKFGSAGSKVVVEEFLDGEEASYIAICDGKTFVPLASSQDHKRAYDNDEGPNTGGMGAYSPAPVVTKSIEDSIKTQIIEPVMSGMIKEGTPFIGVLYAGLMIKNGKAKVLEFNVRFGDPETQPLLMRMNSDLAPILLAASRGELEDNNIDWKDEDALCVVIASGGYPEAYEKGFEISGLDKTNEMKNVVVFHAGTTLGENKNIVNNGGRVLGVTALGKDIISAKENAYKAVEQINWNGCFYRKDIGNKALKQRGANSVQRIGLK